MLLLNIRPKLPYESATDSNWNLLHGCVYADKSYLQDVDPQDSTGTPPAIQNLGKYTADRLA